MAEAVALAVGGAALGAFLNVLLDRMASRRFVDFIKRQKLDDGLFQKLKDAMESVQGVLDDAEEKETTKPIVKKWLHKLKNTFFEADDLLDEIDYEATRLEREAESRSLVDKLPKFLRPRKSFKKGLKARLMEILKNIEELEKEKDALRLTEILENIEDLILENIRGGESNRRVAPHVETSNVFGRKHDQEAIMEELLSDDVNRSNNLSIISIVGLGGIGKSTLARLIYEDESVRNRFDARGWVYVSENFDVPKITKVIAEKVAQIVCNNKALEEIRDELKKKLTEKRLLLVLDDVWSENFKFWERFNYWEQLLTPLKYGRPGSTIIITTRNDDVATSMRSRPIFRLRKLDPNECWQLFCEYAFDDQNFPDYPRFEEIGKEIVKRCDGLPLAVKALGGTLGTKKDVKFWEKVLKNDLWNIFNDGVIPVLRLSYRFLPSRIKQCFAYCSIFPKGL